MNPGRRRTWSFAAWLLGAGVFVAAGLAVLLWADNDAVYAPDPPRVAGVPSTTAFTVEPDEGATAAVEPAGFARTAARATLADGTTCDLCVWLAETPEDRARGLMGVTDLGAADAMAFVYPDPLTGSFWMKNTVMPLSIAFFAPTGDFLDSFEMEPCTTEQCETYPTAADFLVAVEAPQGGLADLGLVAGSTLELLDLPCDDT